MAKNGRPRTIFTEEVEQICLSYFALGLSVPQVASYASLKVESLKSHIKKHPDFAKQVQKAKLTKLVLAHKNEVAALQAGDFRATQAVLLREERKEHHRKMEALRRAEIEARVSSEDKIIPAVLDMNQAIQEINDAFNGKPEQEELTQENSESTTPTETTDIDELSET